MQPLFFDDDVVFVNDVYKTPGTDYTEAIYSDTTTKYKLNFTIALANGDVVKTYPKGLFASANGFLSQTEKRIQDSYYYQKFSYVLKTGKNIADWKNAFTRLVHPAGFIFFGEILIFVQLLTSKNTMVQPGWLIPAGFININIGAFQVGPVQFNTHILEKSYTHFTNGSSQFKKIGMQNHWDNMKFRYLGPISDLSHWTVQDSINNNISTQFGMGGASSLVIT